MCVAAIVSSVLQYVQDMFLALTVEPFFPHTIGVAPCRSVVEVSMNRSILTVRVDRFVLTWLCGVVWVAMETQVWSVSSRCPCMYKMCKHIHVTSRLTRHVFASCRRTRVKHIN